MAACAPSVAGAGRPGEPPGRAGPAEAPVRAGQRLQQRDSPMPHLLLALSVVALLLGPAVARLASRRRSVMDFLDGFVLVAICGLLLFTVLPESISSLGWRALAAALAGVIFPLVFERSGDQGPHGHRALLPILVPAVLGLVAHATLDGAALSQAGTPLHVHDHGSSGGATALALAVVLHRVPVSIVLWSVTRRSFGVVAAAAVLLGLAIFTCLGFVAARPLLGSSLPLLQAFMAGALLHVVIHRPEPTAEGPAGPVALEAPAGASSGDPLRGSEGRGSEKAQRPHVHGRTWPWAELAGGLAAGLALWLFPHGHSLVDWGAFGERMVGVALEGAPVLLVGYLLAGLLVAALPRRQASWLGRGASLTQALRGLAAGAPLPLCSCGIAPVYRGLVRAGVPATAALALLVATPEIGVESVLLTLMLLGAPLTVARLVAAAALALLVGWLVGRIASAAGSGHAQLDSSGPMSSEHRPLLAQRLRRAIPFGFQDVVHDTAPWLLLGLVAAAASPWLAGSNPLASLPAGLDVLGFALLGVAIYVCASAATPMAALMILMGVSPGAALAFLLAGPATNVNTFRVLAELHSRRVAMLVAVSVLAGSVGLGLALDLAFPGPLAAGMTSPAVSGGGTGVGGHPIHQWVSLGLLSVAFLHSLLKAGPRQIVAVVLHLGRPAHEHHSHEPHRGHAHYCCDPEAEDDR